MKLKSKCCKKYKKKDVLCKKCPLIESLGGKAKKLSKKARQRLAKAA